MTSIITVLAFTGHVTNTYLKETRNNTLHQKYRLIYKYTRTHCLDLWFILQQSRSKLHGVEWVINDVEGTRRGLITYYPRIYMESLSKTTTILSDNSRCLHYESTATKRAGLYFWLVETLFDWLVKPQSLWSWTCPLLTATGTTQMIAKCDMRQSNLSPEVLYCNRNGNSRSYWRARGHSYGVIFLYKISK